MNRRQLLFGIAAAAVAPAIASAAPIVPTPIRAGPFMWGRGFGKTATFERWVEAQPEDILLQVRQLLSTVPRVHPATMRISPELFRELYETAFEAEA